MKNEMYIILTLIPLLAGCGDKKEAARGTMPVPEISVASPVVKDITLTKEYPGYLSSEKTVDLVARVNGTLQTIAYAPGSRVRKGQVLFVIEPTIYQDNVEQAEAELNTARANLEYAQNNYARMLEAVKSDAVSQIQVLQSKSNDCHFASGSQQRRSCTEYSTHKSGATAQSGRRLMGLSAGIKSM